MNNTQDRVPALSITVLNYNYGHFLPKCLDSILMQDYRDFEVILINDKSTDNSIEVIKPYLQDPRIRLVDHQVNKGFVASLIEGVELSRGEYITVISADDWVLSPKSFNKQMAVMKQDKEVSFVYTAYGHYDNGEEQCSVWRGATHSFVESGKKVFKDIVLNPFMLHTGTIIRRTAYDKTGGYEPKYRHSVDTRMWLGLCHTGKVAYINEVLYAYRRHGSNMSKNYNTYRKAIEEVLGAISWSFKKFSPAERNELRKVKQQAEQRALVAFVIDEIFRDCYRSGWHCFFVAAKIAPIKTVWQKATFLLVLRTVLGREGYHLIEKTKALFDKKTRQRLAAEMVH